MIDAHKVNEALKKAVCSTELQAEVKEALELFSLEEKFPVHCKLAEVAADMLQEEGPSDDIAFKIALNSMLAGIVAGIYLRETYEVVDGSFRKRSVN